MAIVAPINIDIGIGECIKVLGEIAARRQKREEDFLKDLEDDLDSVSEIIKSLDNIFIQLVNGFSSTKIIQNLELLNEHVENTRKYLYERKLLPRLEKFQGKINTAAHNQKLREDDYRELSNLLRNLESDLEDYIISLTGNDPNDPNPSGAGLKKDWNLKTLYECAKGDDVYDQNGDLIKIDIDELAEHIFKNHDFNLSGIIYRRIGQIQLNSRIIAAF